MCTRSQNGNIKGKKSEERIEENKDMEPWSIQERDWIAGKPSTNPQRMRRTIA